MSGPLLFSLEDGGLKIGGVFGRRKKGKGGNAGLHQARLVISRSLDGWLIDELQGLL